MEGIAPGEEHELSEASLRALLRIRRKLERELED